MTRRVRLSSGVAAPHHVYPQARTQTALVLKWLRVASKNSLRTSSQGLAIWTEIRTFSPTSSGGGTGRRARLRIWFRKE
jgi:hypothetical protein